MISCILAFYIAVSGVPALLSQPAQAADPDALYAHRDDLASARRAEAIWAERLRASPKDFDSAWKLARARYWLGGHATGTDLKTIYEAGIEAGRTASGLEP